jgi:hypothetical protein
VACEFSGIVRDAFVAKGHDAWSCDLLPSEANGQHILGNVLQHLCGRWDLMIAHPPCTHLAVSGARWFKEKEKEQGEAIKFFMELVYAPITRVCIENPIGIMSKIYRKPTQIVQPWEFGHGETKATCLWLRGLLPLIPTHSDKPDMFAKDAPVERVARVHLEPPGLDRWKNRSRTYQGIANAMAEQWGEAA